MVLKNPHFWGNAMKDWGVYFKLQNALKSVDSLISKLSAYGLELSNQRIHTFSGILHNLKQTNQIPTKSTQSKTDNLVKMVDEFTNTDHHQPR